MKYLLTLCCCIALVASTAFSQKWVSTTPQNKTVVLEEYTGIHCGYCPDGHKRAMDLYNAYPGKVALINIHSGGYAAPANNSEPDLRTTEGTQLDGASGLTGYPAGSVNRSTTPWAMDRGKWANVAAGILTQSSPVNVAVRASVDFNTRILTTEVEVYYTGNSASTQNYLTVVLTQDNILGYQSDYGNFNPTNWTADGLYRHNHVLRRFISDGGAFGELLDSVQTGKYIYRKYVDTLPETQINTNITLYNLNVVAFVAQSKSNIYAGDEQQVTYDPSFKADLALTNKTVLPTSLCFSSIHPIAEVMNNAAKQITSFDVDLKLNGQTYTKSFSGTLNQNDKTTLDWGDMPFSPGGTYQISITGFNNVNGGAAFDMDATNDSYSHTGIGFTSKAFTDFTGSFDNGNMPPNTAFDFSQNNAFGIVYSTQTPMGANSSNGAVRYSLHSSWNVAGKPAIIDFGECDLTNATNPAVQFYYAYSDGSQGGTAPKFTAQVSTDCGATWTSIGTVTCVETGQPSNPQYYYVPATTDYKLMSFSLDTYKGQSVLLQVAAIPGTSGNALYLDELGTETATGVNDNNSVATYSVYPNPTSDYIQFANQNYTGKEFGIYSVLGLQVMSGIYNSEINVNTLPSGVYTIKLNGEAFKFVKN